MPRYVVTVPSSKSAREAFALMADMTTFPAWDPGIADSRVLLVGKNSVFTSIDLIEITPTSSGCNITYDAKLTFNGLLAPMNIGLGLVFNKIGDRAAKGLRRVLA